VECNSAFPLERQELEMPPDKIKQCALSARGASEGMDKQTSDKQSPVSFV